MIISLPATTTRAISRQLTEMRESGGQVTTGRVLSLIVVLSASDDVETAISTAIEASREHPARVLVMITEDDADGPNSFNAEIRLGGDAGAAEVIVMWIGGQAVDHLESIATPLLLPDTPIVAWWPCSAPEFPAESGIGMIATRRITDSQADCLDNAIVARRSGYSPGDTDLAWARLTSWRGVLASIFDLPPMEQVTKVTIYGPSKCPSVDLAGGWLADRLGIGVRRVDTGAASPAVDDNGQPEPPVSKIVLERTGSTVELEVLDATTSVQRVTGREELAIALSARSDVDCLAEELRHLDPDVAYAKALRGLSRLSFVRADQLAN